MSFGIIDAQLRYEKWWVGKRCRPAGRGGEFRKVAKVEAQGPPSFVYGQCQIWYEDAPTENHWVSFQGFKPRKQDMEVHPDDLPKKEAAKQAKQADDRQWMDLTVKG